MSLYFIAFTFILCLVLSFLLNWVFMFYLSYLIIMGSQIYKILSYISLFLIFMLSWNFLFLYLTVYHLFLIFYLLIILKSQDISSIISCIIPYFPSSLWTSCQSSLVILYKSLHLDLFSVRKEYS